MINSKQKNKFCEFNQFSLDQIARSNFSQASLTPDENSAIPYDLTLLIAIIQDQMGLTNEIGDYNTASSLISKCISIIKIDDCYKNQLENQFNTELIKSHIKELGNKYIEFLFASVNKKKGKYFGLNKLNYIETFYKDGIIPFDVQKCHQILRNTINTLFNDIKSVAYGSLLLTSLKTCFPLHDLIPNDIEYIELIIADDQDENSYTKYGISDCYGRYGIGISNLITKYLPYYNKQYGIQFRSFIEGNLGIIPNNQLNMYITKGSLFYDPRYDQQNKGYILCIPQSAFKSVNIPDIGRYKISPSMLKFLLGISQIYRKGTCISDFTFISHQNAINEIKYYTLESIKNLQENSDTTPKLITKILHFDHKRWDKNLNQIVSFEPSFFDEIYEDNTLLNIENYETDEENNIENDDNENIEQDINLNLSLLYKLINIFGNDTKSILYNHPLLFNLVTDWISNFYKQMALKSSIKGIYLVACPYNSLDNEYLPIKKLVFEYYKKWYKEKTGKDLAIKDKLLDIKNIQIIISTTLPFGLYLSQRHPIRTKDDYQLYYVINPKDNEIIKCFINLNIVTKKTILTTNIDDLWNQYIGGYLSRKELCYWKDCFWIGTKTYKIVGGDFDGDKSLFIPLEENKVNEWYGWLNLSKGLPNLMIELLEHHVNPWNDKNNGNSIKQGIRTIGKRLNKSKEDFFCNNLNNNIGLVHWTINILFLYAKNNMLKRNKELEVLFPKYDNELLINVQKEKQTIKTILNELAHQLQLAVDGFKHGSFPCIEFVKSVSNSINEWLQSITGIDNLKQLWLYQKKGEQKYSYYKQVFKIFSINPNNKQIDNPELYRLYIDQDIANINAYLHHYKTNFIFYSYGNNNQNYEDCISQLCKLVHDEFGDSNTIKPLPLYTYKHALFPNSLSRDTQMKDETGSFINVQQYVRSMLNNFTESVKNVDSEIKIKQYQKIIAYANNIQKNNPERATQFAQFTWEFAHDENHIFGEIAFLLWADIIKKQLTEPNIKRAFKLPPNKNINDNNGKTIKTSNFELLSNNYPDLFIKINKFKLNNYHYKNNYLMLILYLLDSNNIWIELESIYLNQTRPINDIKGEGKESYVINFPPLGLEFEGKLIGTTNSKGNKEVIVFLN